MFFHKVCEEGNEDILWKFAANALLTEEPNGYWHQVTRRWLHASYEKNRCNQPSSNSGHQVTPQCVCELCFCSMQPFIWTDELAAQIVRNHGDAYYPQQGNDLAEVRILYANQMHDDPTNASACGVEMPRNPHLVRCTCTAPDPGTSFLYQAVAYSNVAKEMAANAKACLKFEASKRRRLSEDAHAARNNAPPLRRLSRMSPILESPSVD